jgi:adenosylcobinamide-GDP ribazoletransferase
MFDNDGHEGRARRAERRRPDSLVGDLVTAARFLTRLPLRGFVVEDRSLAEAMAVFPLVGLFIGVAGALGLLVSSSLGLGPLAAAILAVGCQVALTGGLHEDGLADTADGFWGGDNPQRRLTIMRDSQIGSYGVMALLIVTLLRCALLAELADDSLAGAAVSLLAAAAVSRHAMVALSASGEPARRDGLAFSAGKPGSEARRLSLLIAVAAAAIGLWWAHGFWGPILSLLLAQVAVSGIAALARRRIGGYTGDVCGAVQQVSEIAVLAGAAMIGG